MEQMSPAEQMESIESLQSTIRKMEKALAQMRQKGANTTLIEKRLKATHIALALLEQVWQQKPHAYTEEAVWAARDVLVGLLPSIESSYASAKMGSAQKTLLERRIRALDLAVQAIDNVFPGGIK